MSKEEFTQRLKEWRKTHKVTQRELSIRLGVSISTVAEYESGRITPSCETADKLILIMQVDPEDVPRGRHRGCSYDTPFTDEERQFAEIHHSCVFHYLNTRRLPEDDWYDVVVFGYLHAVKVWFARHDLHKYTFLTIAYNYMRSAVRNERKKRSALSLVSFDDVIPNTDGLTYGDMLCDPRDCVGI